METTKSFNIAKQVVLEAWKKVKSNEGAAGIDNETVEEFEQNLSKNLYKIWNRMSSGTYFPPPVKAVGIPKKSGGERILGIPTVADRVAQMTTKRYLEPHVEPIFDENSYGYRPNKSAIEAVKITRQRCWKYDWVLEFDIKKLFDTVDHKLLMKVVKRHMDNKWSILYIERWLKVPFIKEDGTMVERTQGTPQGGVISPLLANMFLHYVFDKWMRRKFPSLPFCRYADDGIIHCKSEAQAKLVRDKLSQRFRECNLELHSDKTKIIYCKDEDRQDEYDNISFDFLGFTFRPRLSKNKWGKCFVNFTPAVSQVALKEIRKKARKYKMHLRSDKTLEDLSNLFGPTLRGWVNYYSHFYKSAMYPTFEHINRILVRWAMRKHKRFRRKRKAATHWLGRLARRDSKLFVHWQFGIYPAAK
ncbi:group II intron reverse transcriptase/maturase [bacterium]|nr:group II intron reverse transcriptase/maturase [bacterium]